MELLAREAEPAAQQRAEVLRIFDATFAITYALQLIAITVAMMGVAGLVPEDGLDQLRAFEGIYTSQPDWYAGTYHGRRRGYIFFRVNLKIAGLPPPELLHASSW